MPASTSSPAAPEGNAGRWTARHEGMQVRGKGVAALPTSVRYITEAQCVGDSTPDFWQALGFQRHYELLKDGLQFVVAHNDFLLQVNLAVLKRLPEWGAVDKAAPLTTDHWLLEVTARAIEGEHVDASNAIGSLGELLLPLAELKRP
ncbi:hypothetical protein WJX72_001377 [[Myrmecia] bisecta]|uniref:Uncharacterized protein n=1 Tax=[Myrmecia] bisecta TaxID=41462 RepID=A0AAW1QE74_9CHLO